MYKTTAKFNSKCAETGNRITKGEDILYDRPNKRVYSKHSQKFKDHSNETVSTDQMVQANEEAYFDDWARANNI